MNWVGFREPLRPERTSEEISLAQAMHQGPFVAWRDAEGELRVRTIGIGHAITIGRAPDRTVSLSHPHVSRLHAEVTMRNPSGDPDAACVYLLDCDSKHGTEQRSVRLVAHGVERRVGPWRPVPRSPARPAQLAAGEHDVRIAGERYILIGGVPVDDGFTLERDDSLPEPTLRERHVLIELCRPFFEAPGEIAATPSNAQIAERMTPRISSDRVSDLLSQLYTKFALTGTKEQNRVRLVELARRHHLVEADDYR